MRRINRIIANLVLVFSAAAYADPGQIGPATDYIDNMKPKGEVAPFFYGREILERFSGNVNILYKDITQSGGAGGIDLEFTRYHGNSIQSVPYGLSNNQKSYWRLNTNYAIYKKELVHDIFDYSSHSPGNNYDFDGAPYLSLVLPNGEVKSFFKNGSQLKSKDYWVAKPVSGNYLNGVIVYSPNNDYRYTYSVKDLYVRAGGGTGLPYLKIDELDEPNYLECTASIVNTAPGNLYQGCTKSSNMVMLLSKVEHDGDDVITYHYSGSEGQERKLTSITAQDGRSITIERNPQGLIKKVSASNGQSVNYLWVLTDDGYKISKATFGEGYIASYDYYPNNHSSGGVIAARSRLKSVSFNTGLTHTYNYWGLTSASGESGYAGYLSNINRSDATTGASFDVAFPEGGWDRKLVKEIGPDYCDIYEYVSYKDEDDRDQYATTTTAGSSTYVVGMGWVSGQLASYTRYPNTGCTGTSIYKDEYEWISHKVIDGFKMISSNTEFWRKANEFTWAKEIYIPTIGYDFKTYDFWDNHHYTPVLKKKTITKDGQIFTKTWSGFNTYGKPTVLVEEGSKRRVTNLTYFNNLNLPSAWIVNKPKDEIIIDENSSAQLGWLKRSYAPNGLLTHVDDMGIEYNFDYLTSGDLDTISWNTGQGSGDISIVYENYKFGTAQKITYPDGGIYTNNINSKGQITWEQDQEGAITSYTYDDLGRHKSVSRPAQLITNYSWPNINTQQIVQGNAVTKYHYDGQSREILLQKYDATAPGDKINLITEYDNKDNVAFKSFESGSVSETDGIAYTYDALNRVKTSVNTTDNASSTFSYWGASGQLGHTVTDDRGYIKKYRYDSYGDGENQLVKIEEQVAGSNYVVTTIGRNLVGDMLSVSQGGLLRSFTYYPSTPRLLKSANHPELGLVEYAYDDMGNRISEKIAGQSPVISSYDTMNRLASVDYPDNTGDIIHGYYKTGLLKSIDNGHSRWDYQYNPNGQLLNETLAVEGRAFPLSYTYDSLGALDSIGYPTGEVVDVDADALGRLTQIDNYATDISYHPNGGIEEITYGNNVTVSIAQNARRYIDSITAQNGSSSTIMGLNYGYDSVGNVLSINDSMDSNNNRAMTYDGIGRLSTATASVWWGQQSYIYDAVSNIKQKNTPVGNMVYSYHSSNNRLLSTNEGHVFSYDANGNVIGNGADGFQYNKANQLVEVTNQGINYSYDGHGRRVTADRTATGGDKVYYVYGSKGVLMHSVNAQKVNAKNYIYLKGKKIAVDLTCSKTDTDNDGIPDCLEDRWGLNKHSAADAALDTDGDSLTNLQEYLAGTNISLADTDGDGINDGYEVNNDLQPLINDASEDLDGDGLTNQEELALGTMANNTDSDNDGRPDNEDPNPLFNEALLVPILHILLHG